MRGRGLSRPWGALPPPLQLWVGAQGSPRGSFCGPRAGLVGLGRSWAEAGLALKGEGASGLRGRGAAPRPQPCSPARTRPAEGPVPCFPGGGASWSCLWAPPCSASPCSVGRVCVCGWAGGRALPAAQASGQVLPSWGPQFPQQHHRGALVFPFDELQTEAWPAVAGLWARRPETGGRCWQRAVQGWGTTSPSPAAVRETGTCRVPCWRSRCRAGDPQT